MHILLFIIISYYFVKKDKQSVTICQLIVH